MYPTIISRAVRCPAPFVQLRGRWIVRRLSPHCCRVELQSMPADRDELKLLHAMGAETANIHLGTPNASSKIRRHLKKQAPEWLHKAARAMAKAVGSDWRVWKKSGP